MTYNTTEALEGLGNTAQALGQLDEARAPHERVLAIRRRAAPDDPHVADALLDLGAVLLAQGHVAEARAHADDALARYRAAYGTEHPQVAVALRQRAEAGLGTPEAVHDLDAALAITIAALGPEHPDVAFEQATLGAAYAGLRRWRDAIEHDQRAIALMDKVLGPTHAMTALALAGLGQALIERGDAAAAIPVLERALAIDADGHALPAATGRARWYLARARWDRGDHLQPRAQAEQALHELAQAADPTSVATHAEAVAWLTTHPAGATP